MSQSPNRVPIRQRVARALGLPSVRERSAATAAAMAAPPPRAAETPEQYMRRVAGQRLVQELMNKTGEKQWLSKIPISTIGAGMNGVVFGIAEPNKVLKVTVGNATREVNALRRLLAAGANFVPYVNGNFINIARTNVSTNIKNRLFPKKAVPVMSTYVMQKVGHMTLWGYAKTRTLTNKNKNAIRSEIARIIRFMHEHGISHGDLHAGNILVELTADGNVKKLWVIDFGRYVNIPMGATEKAAYNALRKDRIHTNYNLFNAARKPLTQLYSGRGGVARRNQNLYREMYRGNNKNLA